jgi:hypothetical protein
MPRNSPSPANEERDRQKDRQENHDTAIDAEQEAGLLIGRHLVATNALNFLWIFMLAFGEG